MRLPEARELRAERRVGHEPLEHPRLLPARARARREHVLDASEELRVVLGCARRWRERVAREVPRVEHRAREEREERAARRLVHQDVPVDRVRERGRVEPGGEGFGRGRGGVWEGGEHGRDRLGEPR